MNDLFQKVAENVLYVLSFFAIIVILFVVAILLEKVARKKSGDNQPVFSVRKIAMVGMFSAIAMILMLFDFRCPLRLASISWISVNCQFWWGLLLSDLRQGL